MSKKKDKVPDGPFSKLAELKKKIAAQEEAAKKPPAPGRAGTASRSAAPAATRPRADVSQSYSIARGGASAADDDMSFHRLMSGVVPLEDVKSRVGKTADAGPSSTAQRLAQGREAHVKEEEAAKEHLRELAFGVQRFEVVDDGKHVEGRRSDIPDDVVRKLRRGQLPIDARLDLHGMRAEEARIATHAFLRDKRTRGERCVLIIHGRGEHSSGPAVLRGEMSAWLSQSGASEHVAAFTTAIEADGGEGAVYVLLRR